LRGTQLLDLNTYYRNGSGVAVSYHYNNWVLAKFSVARRMGGNPGTNPITEADGDGTNDKTRHGFNGVVYV